jgi:acetolactate synthase I/II/III large subunit
VNGAESLVAAARHAGIDVCFANPGTTELPIVAALDAVPGVRAVLGLSEAVCTGAADGYGRMLDRPALVLLHFGVGLANGACNLHNARRARTPVVVVVGDHPEHHLSYDTPLTSDISALAHTVSGWVGRTSSASTLADDVARAAAAAADGRVSTLVVPADALSDHIGDGETARAHTAEAPRAVDALDVEQVAKLLQTDHQVGLLLGGRGLRARGLRAAGRIAAATGCELLAETFSARLDRGPDLPSVTRIHYFAEFVKPALERLSIIVLAGAAEPVSFFARPDGPSRLVPDGCQVATLAGPDDALAADVALEALADFLDAPALGPSRGSVAAPPARGKLRPDCIGRAVAGALPEGAVVVDEAHTGSFAVYDALKAANAHSVLSVTGGGIGQGMPVSTGAAVACPDRKVVTLQADGSAMYTVQALWTQAREGLPVTTIVLSNRKYQILRWEMSRIGVKHPGEQGSSLLSLDQPAIDWPQLAAGLGVPGVSVTTGEDLVDELGKALADDGPKLIEAVM